MFADVGMRSFFLSVEIISIKSAIRPESSHMIWEVNYMNNKQKNMGKVSAHL